MIELTISNIQYAKLFLLFFETSYLTFAYGPCWLLPDTSVVSADLQLVVSNCCHDQEPPPSGSGAATAGCASPWTTPPSPRRSGRWPWPGGSTSPSSLTSSTLSSSSCGVSGRTCPRCTSCTTPRSPSSPGSAPSSRAAATRPSGGCGTPWSTSPCTHTTSSPPAVLGKFFYSCNQGTVKVLDT